MTFFSFNFVLKYFQKPAIDNNKGKLMYFPLSSHWIKTQLISNDNLENWMTCWQPKLMLEVSILNNREMENDFIMIYNGTKNFHNAG